MYTAVVRSRCRQGVVLVVLLAVISTLLGESSVRADGKVMPPAEYEGSLEEQAQEAILIFHASQQPGEAREDVILRIRVEGEVENFAWVIPFPNQPKVTKEEARLFKELHNYVEARLARRRIRPGYKSDGAAADEKGAEPKAVEVLSRKIVGTFDVAVVREIQAGELNKWLQQEGYQTLEGDDADEVLKFYREKKYVYACIKVSDAELRKDAPVDLHPLRFSFKTGGRDGMFYPMKLTGLQQQPFDVNLYVFYGKWVNDHLSKFGYEHRGFRRKYRDWDTQDCEPDAGKKYSAPENDVFLEDHAHRIPTVTKLFQKLHPGQQYYLTNIQARGLKPEEVRNWSDDLWLFPYYTDRSFVPYDARPGGPAAAAWPEAYPEAEADSAETGTASKGLAGRPWLLPGVGIGIGALVCVAICIGFCRTGRWPCCGSRGESSSDTTAPPDPTDSG